MQQLSLDALPLDDRIAEMMEYINSSEFDSLHYEDVLDNVFLSGSRLTHLFKEEMKLLFMKYIIWRRLLYTSVQLLTTTTTITIASHEYVIADSSHFSRTFKHNFGINPREIFHKKLKDDHLVHVLRLDNYVK